MPKRAINEPTYMVQPGRNIFRNGSPYIRITRAEEEHGKEGYLSPVETTDVTHLICRLLNQQEEKKKQEGKETLETLSRSLDKLEQEKDSQRNH